MNILKVEIRGASASSAKLSEDSLDLELKDGRELSVPIVWFPRLCEGTEKERSNLQIIGDGEGIHWPDLDEDISVAHLLAGYPSMESQSSLKKWLEARKNNGVDLSKDNGSSHIDSPTGQPFRQMDLIK